MVPHLLVFNRSYYPDLGATGQLLTELCEDLVARHGWEVTVVAGTPTVALQGTGPRAGRALLRRETVRGVTILRAGGTRFSKARFPGRAVNYLSYFAAAALAGLRARRPEVVMSQTDPPILGLVALAWARRWRAPFVFVCKDLFPEVARLVEDFHSPSVERALERVSRFLIDRAAAVVAIGETMKRRLVELRGADPARVIVIHDWGDREAMSGGSRDSALARQHGLQDRLQDRFVVMHAGNIGLSQGLEALVDAAAIVGPRCPDVDVVFVGDGAKREALEERALSLGAGNVRFLPYFPRERLRDVYAAADLFVISLKPELAGFIVPSKLYPILAAGKPYVAAVEEECEVAEITRLHQCGLLVPPGDAGALAEGIELLRREREMLAALAANAWKASELFDRPRSVAAYHTLLSSLVVEG